MRNFMLTNLWIWNSWNWIAWCNDTEHDHKLWIVKTVKRNYVVHIQNIINSFIFYFSHFVVCALHVLLSLPLRFFASSRVMVMGCFALCEFDSRIWFILKVFTRSTHRWKMTTFIYHLFVSCRRQPSELYAIRIKLNTA